MIGGQNVVVITKRVTNIHLKKKCVIMMKKRMKIFVI